MTTQIKSPHTGLDLKQAAPRSARIRLGGYMLLPRLIDKCRADIAGTIGDYHTNCMLDQEFLLFVGIDYDALREQIERGAGDHAILDWTTANQSQPRSPWEIVRWNEYQESRAPAHHTDLSDYFLGVVASHDKTRGDIRSWPDLLDFDDYCSFGGIA